ncbi:MAG: spore coat protein, partial [bacterium]|nr:spore coat protein [bacterium]
MAQEFTIGKTKVGGNHPCFIVAEIGINFNGEYANALKLIDAAAHAKCNAVKFQLFFAKEMYPPAAGDD